MFTYDDRTSPRYASPPTTRRMRRGSYDSGEEEDATEPQRQRPYHQQQQHPQAMARTPRSGTARTRRRSIRGGMMTSAPSTATSSRRRSDLLISTEDEEEEERERREDYFNPFLPPSSTSPLEPIPSGFRPRAASASSSSSYSIGPLDHESSLPPPPRPSSASLRSPSSSPSSAFRNDNYNNSRNHATSNSLDDFLFWDQQPPQSSSSSYASSTSFMPEFTHKQRYTKEKEKEEESRLSLSGSSSSSSSFFSPQRDDDEADPMTQSLSFVFEDPISMELMENAVMTVCGHSFEESTLNSWIAQRKLYCPLCNTPLSPRDIRPNYKLREAVDKYKLNKVLEQRRKQQKEKESAEKQRQQEERVREEREREAQQLAKEAEEEKQRVVELEQRLAEVTRLYEEEKSEFEKKQDRYDRMKKREKEKRERFKQEREEVEARLRELEEEQRRREEEEQTRRAELERTYSDLEQRYLAERKEMERKERTLQRAIKEREEREREEREQLLRERAEEEERWKHMADEERRKRAAQFEERQKQLEKKYREEMKQAQRRYEEEIREQRQREEAELERQRLILEDLKAKDEERRRSYEEESQKRLELKRMNQFLAARMEEERKEVERMKRLLEEEKRAKELKEKENASYHEVLAKSLESGLAYLPAIQFPNVSATLSSTLLQTWRRHNATPNPLRQSNVIGPLIASLRDYDLHDRRGSHRNSPVWRATDRKTGEPVALKLRVRIKGHNDLTVFREAMLLHGLVHPNIPKLLKLVPGKHIGRRHQEFYMILPFVPFDLDHFLNISMESLNTTQIRHLMFQLLLVVCYIHSCEVVHNDIRPTSILIASDGSGRIFLAGWSNASSLLSPSSLASSSAFSSSKELFSNEQQSLHSSSSASPSASTFSLFSSLSASSFSFFSSSSSSPSPSTPINLHYTSPELILHQYHPSSSSSPSSLPVEWRKKSDIWSCGCILAQLLNSKRRHYPLFAGRSPEQVLQNILSFADIRRTMGEALSNRFPEELDPHSAILLHRPKDSFEHYLSLEAENTEKSRKSERDGSTSASLSFDLQRQLEQSLSSEENNYAPERQRQHRQSTGTSSSLSHQQHHEKEKETEASSAKKREEEEEERKLALDLLSKMLCFDPNQRITALEALNHRYFASFDAIRRRKKKLWKCALPNHLFVDDNLSNFLQEFCCGLFSSSASSSAN